MRRISIMTAVAVLMTAGTVFAVHEFAPTTLDARPVSNLSSTTAVINWQTKEPVETRIMIREGSWIAGTPGYENEWEKGKIIEGVQEKRTEHSIMLTGLKPATRYFYRVYDPSYEPENEQAARNERIWSWEPPWRREYSFTTLAGPGGKAIIRIPVKVLISANIINLDSVNPDTPKPEPMSDEEIQMYKDEMEQCVLFYWVNSGMLYWIDLEYFVQTEWLKTGAEKEEHNEFFKGLRNSRDALRVFDPEDISNHQVAWPLKDDKIYSGQVIVNCVRRWNDDRKQWEYEGSGGWTFGVDWMQWGDKTQRPAPGRSGFLGGSDIAWLLSHEYHHQKESQHWFSGLVTEHDRVVFCHFAPKYRSPMGHDWKWDTAFAHGEHWDGIAWELRMLTTTQYMRNMFGEIYVTKDTDGDGIPDDDPNLPLDEKRFGSDPKKYSTDGSGMSDLEKVMAATWTPTLLTNMRDKVYNPGYPQMWEMASGKKLKDASPGTGYTIPKATVKDSDGDGVIDKEDPYPVYPWEPKIVQAEIEPDGKAEEWSGVPVLGQFSAYGIEFTMKAAYDTDNLYYMMDVKGETRGITLNIDGDADGWYVGNDNMDIRITQDGDSKLAVTRAVTHLCASREWPHFDGDSPMVRTHKIKVMENDKEVEKEEKWTFERERRYGTHEDIKFAVTKNGDRQIIEIAIPNGTTVFPIRIGPNHVFAHAVYVGVPNRGAVPVYEPYTLFQIKAE